jgi:hypothetical protein
MSAAAPPRPPDANLTLAKAMGSKRGYDPMPPDQHEWQRTEGEPPLYRLWSWLCAHTIAYGHRSPFAVTEMAKDHRDAYIPGSGRPRTLAHAAKDLGMDIGQASRVWKDGEERGLWHRDGSRHLYLNGDVSITDVMQANKKAKDDRSINLSRIEQLKLKHLPQAEREAFYALWNPAQDFRRDLAAAAMAQARETCDEMDDTILRRVGIERKRHGKAPRPPVPVPQMLFEFVQSMPPALTVQIKPVDGTTGEDDGEKIAEQPPHIRNSEKPFRENLLSVDRLSLSEDRPTDSVPFPTELKPEDAKIESIERLVSDLLPHLHDVPNQTLSRQIIDGLKGAPLEHLRAYIQVRIRKTDKLGILRDYAQAVGRAWLREQGARQRHAEAKAAGERHAAEAARHEAQKILDNPRAGSEEKQLARQILGSDSKTAGGDG